MTLTEFGIIVAIATGTSSLIGVVYVGGWKLGGLQVKIDTMWDFLMRRAISEGLEKGVLKVNSPVIVSAEAKAWMHEMAGKLKEFYAKLGRRLSERELAFEIERRFGDEILKKVCIPHGLYSGTCLLIAMEIAKEMTGSEISTETA